MHAQDGDWGTTAPGEWGGAHLVNDQEEA